MRSRLQTPTGEIDLCAELGVSGRTLRLAFRERFALGPMAYYQALRLYAARLALKAADREAPSVARVALHFGFHHMGKFAGYYRRLFGEVPSDTASQSSVPPGNYLQRVVPDLPASARRTLEPAVARV